MYAEALLSTMLSTTLLSGSIEKEQDPTHFISPKVFCMVHQEKENSFVSPGGGLEYVLKNYRGINLSISLLNGVSGELPLWKGSTTMSFRVPLSAAYTMSPLVAVESSCRKIEEREDEALRETNTRAVLGCGIRRRIFTSMDIYAEVSIFKDIQNDLICVQDQHFWGSSMQKPFGIKIGCACEFFLKNNNFISIKSHFLKTFEKHFYQFHNELSFNWGF